MTTRNLTQESTFRSCRLPIVVYMYVNAERKSCVSAAVGYEGNFGGRVQRWQEPMADPTQIRIGYSFRYL